MKIIDNELKKYIHEKIRKEVIREINRQLSSKNISRVIREEFTNGEIKNVLNNYIKKTYFENGTRYK